MLVEGNAMTHQAGTWRRDQAQMNLHRTNGLRTAQDLALRAGGDGTYSLSSESPELTGFSRLSPSCEAFP